MSDLLKIRCSAIGEIMTGTSKGWKVAQSTTCVNYLKKLYREQRYNRKQEFESKYTRKGITGEQNALTLISRVKKYFFKKNDQRIFNEYLTGEPDAYVGKDIYNASQGYDIKCSWSLWTFPFATDKLDPDYRYQDIGYMSLTGAKKWTTIYCLVNAPGNLITHEKQKIWYAMDCPSDRDPEYLDKIMEVEKNMIFDMKQFLKDNPGYDLAITDWQYDIPLEERIVEFTVERNEKEIQTIYDRVIECRSFYYSNIDTDNISVLLAEHDHELNTTLIK